MRKLMVFNSVTADGYFTDKNNDMSWAHRQSDAKSGGELVFGRVTYEMMKSFWPTPMAAAQFPDVAKGMNELPKVVFSKTMNEATWNNTRLIKGDLENEVRKLKDESGDQLVLMGSGSIVSQLTQAGLVDEYELVLIPLVLGEGRTMFEGVKNKLPLKLINTRTFKNGNVLLTYEPAS
jgi:dihydrofolate reductase